MRVYSRVLLVFVKDVGLFLFADVGASTSGEPIKGKPLYFGISVIDYTKNILSVVQNRAADF